MNRWLNAHQAGRERLYSEDVHGQVDGDAAPAPPPLMSASSGGAQFGMPPWHMWGNTQQLTTVVEEASGVARLGVTQQLNKIAYKRPETWHWLFSARLISGPANTALFFSTVRVFFNVTVGIGRSAIIMRNDLQQAFAINGDIRSFERFAFQWGPVNPVFPSGAHIWSAQAQAPPRNFASDGPFPDTGPPLTELVAQDIQVDVQLTAITVAGNVAALGQPVVVEVSGQWAPKTHVRPDWFNNFDGVVPGQVFSGAELEGR